VRPSRLADGEPTSTHRVGTDLRTSMSTSTRRADLVAALLDVIVDGSFIKQAVTVTS
jgi:hypothetical protein